MSFRLAEREEEVRKGLPFVAGSGLCGVAGETLPRRSGGGWEKGAVRGPAGVNVPARSQGLACVSDRFGVTCGSAVAGTISALQVT
ncbi:hypothetical protein GCM10023083_22640 [Streptomyces phyllanthi]